MPAIIEPVGPPGPGAPKRPLVVRLLWFLGLATAGVGLTAVAAYGLKWLMRLG